MRYVQVLGSAILILLFAAAAARSQVSYDEAMARLRQKQAQRNALGPATHPASAPTTEPVDPDTRDALEEFAKAADQALDAGARAGVAPDLEDAYSKVLSHTFRLTASTDGVTKNVPIGESGLFGDRPNEAVVVSLALKSRSLDGSTEVKPTAELYLHVPDPDLPTFKSGDVIHGQVSFTRVEIDPAEQKSRDGQLRFIYAARIRFLGDFKPDIRPRAVEITTVEIPEKVSPPDPLAPITHASSPRGVGDAHRIVFICDATGSMLSKYSTVRRVISQAVKQLDPAQNFDIVFFQKQSLISLDQSLIPANSVNKDRAERLIEKVTPRDEGDPNKAMDLAIELRPDSIFLLSDGDFGNNAPVLAHIRELERGRRIKINTIAFVADTDRDTEFMAFMKKIAEETGGIYRFVRESDL